MNLLVDIGNSRIKWVFLLEIKSTFNTYGFYNSISIIEAKKYFPYLLKLSFYSFLKKQKITRFEGNSLIDNCKLTWSCVANKEIEKIIYQGFCKFLNRSAPNKINVDLTKSFIFKFGKVRMKINRRIPNNLGLDRWASMIGLASLNLDRKGVVKNMVVVSVGTATVYDFLSLKKKKKFNTELILHHGLIFPGFETMNQSLVSINPKLTGTNGKLMNEPGNTSDSILTAISLNQISPLYSVKKDSLIILHGGKHERWEKSVRKFFPNHFNIIYDPWLIFRGLYWISKN